MSDAVRKAVYDCNVFLQALGNPIGPAGRCVEAAFAGRVTLYVDANSVEELRDVAGRPEVARKLRILATRVDEFLSDLRKVAVFVKDVPTIFTYERDPDDAHYVNLALVAGAPLIVSRDKDLLDLMDDKRPEARSFKARFPSLRILDPMQFLSEE